MSQRIAVVGAGISGVSVARMLKEAGHEVFLLEKARKAGGLIRCDWVEGKLYHRVGGHVFNSKSPEVHQWFWKHFDRDAEFLSAQRNAKIRLGEDFIGYPIENHLYQLGRPVVEKVVEELLARSQSDPFAYPNFEEFLKGHFGPTLYELYFGPYNRKIWNTDLKNVSMEWLAGKLPMPDLKRMMVGNILREEEAEMVHSSFYYARQGGSQFIIDRLSEGLPLHTETPLQSLKKTQQGWLLNGHYQADRVVYTGDVRLLHRIMENPGTDEEQTLRSLQDLRSNSTSNLFCEVDALPFSWLYFPEEQYQAHRIIFTGNFSPNNNGNSDRLTCVVEFSGQVDRQTMEAETRKMPGNLKPLAHNHRDPSYVIQDHHAAERVKAVKALYEPQGLHLLGRFAEWEYYNMDKCMEAGLKLAERVSES